jgi:hypothetical protein
MGETLIPFAKAAYEAARIGSATWGDLSYGAQMHWARVASAVLDVASLAPLSNPLIEQTTSDGVEDLIQRIDDYGHDCAKGHNTPKQFLAIAESVAALARGVQRNCDA